jgi:hypothetical protein
MHLGALYSLRCGSWKRRIRIHVRRFLIYILPELDTADVFSTSLGTSLGTFGLRKLPCGPLLTTTPTNHQQMSRLDIVDL